MYVKGCRCEPCKQSARDYSAALYVKNPEKFKAASKAYKRSKNPNQKDWQPAQHGTRSKYVRGCRCELCKEASRDYANAHRATNPEQAREKSRVYRLATPGVQAAQQRERRAKNPEPYREHDRKKYAKNPQKTIAQVKAWVKAHPEQKRTTNRNYKARFKGAIGTHTVEDLQIRRKLFDDCCAYCGSKLRLNFDWDHGQPLTRDGSNWPDNLYPACKPCNNSKYTRNVEEYVSYRLEHDLPVHWRWLV